MNKFCKRLAIALAAAGIGSAALAAADKYDCDHMGMGPGGMAMHGHEGYGPAAKQMKERMEKRHAALRDKLKLTAAQEPAWKTFSAEMAPAGMPQWPERAEMEKLPAPERMEKMMGMMKEREEHMGKRLAALKTFYATLTPAQQKIFDAEFGMHHRRR